LSNTPSKKYVWKEFTGKGNITFQSGAIYTINFEIYIMDSGRLVGSILFTTIDSSLNDELNRNQTFTVSNEAQNQNRLMISAEQCAFYSINTMETNIPIPLITGNFTISNLKVFDNRKIKKIDEPELRLRFEFGVLNYYSRSKFSLNTEIGEIQNINVLNDNEIAILRNSFIPFISTLLHVHIKIENSLEDTKQHVLNVVGKVLDLTSFALMTEHRWSYYKIFYFDDSSQRFEFAYSEAINQLPRPPESHNNIDDSSLQDFLNLTYNNYNVDLLNEKYNFSVALAWYLDSLSLRYEVMRFISASTAFESILQAYHGEGGLIMPKNIFKLLSEKIATVINKEAENTILQEDVDQMVRAIPRINELNYRTKARKLLEYLGLLDEKTEALLGRIVQVRSPITHTGRSKDSDKHKVIETYFELFNLLTKIFFRILVVDEIVFKREFHNMTLKPLGMD
jgi:hypothetical protein